MDITRYLANYYPSLIPTPHQDEINARLDALHALNYFSLSFTGRAHVTEGFKAAVEQRLARDITQRYREALQYKLAM
jgi:glutathione S-transferase